MMSSGVSNARTILSKVVKVLLQPSIYSPMLKEGLFWVLFKEERVLPTCLYRILDIFLGQYYENTLVLLLLSFCYLSS